MFEHGQQYKPQYRYRFLSTCGSFTNQNPNPPYSSTSRRQFRVTWFNLVPVAFNGLMFNMRFVVLAGGSSTVQWDLATAGNCEYADELADVISIPASGWVSGSVNFLSISTPQVFGNLSLLTGANSTLSVSAYRFNISMADFEFERCLGKPCQWLNFRWS